MTAIRLRGSGRAPSTRRVGTLGRIVLSLSASLLVACMPGCGRTGARSHELSVNGSTTILPIAEVAAEDFERLNPDDSVLVSGVGSSAGIESVAQGTSDIGTSSRELRPEEEDLGLVDIPIAYDAIAVIVNPSNTVRSLTREQVKAIFQGRIVNWADVGGSDMPIGLVNRDEASGTREAFSKIVLDGEPFESRAVVLPGTGQVRAVVGEAPGAVGYISLGFATREVKTVAIDGVEPSVSSAMNGTYPIRRVLHLFTNGSPSGLAARFIEYVLSDAVQEGAVRDAGFIPIAAQAGNDA